MQSSRALGATGQTEAAEATIKKAIALRPGYWNNYVRLGVFYANHGRYKEAEAPFKQVIRLVPDNPVGYTNLGSIYHLEGLEPEAEQSLNDSIKTRPTPQAFSNLATVYFFSHRYADAVPIYEKLVADGTNDYVIWGNLGDAYRWTPGQAQKAPKAYETAIVLAGKAAMVNPLDAAALSSLALYCAKSGLTTRALQASGKALAAAPDDKSVLFNAAVVSELAGERAQALTYIRRAILGGYSPNEIATEPELGKLREDPRYQAALPLNKGR
jgi:eukaryotic-like serine/threonine-protein kinase